jgi:hypothetical protein
MTKKIVLVIIIVVFFMGLYFYLTQNNVLEGFGGEGFSQKQCPDILIQSGAKFYLYNSKLAKVPGVNPVEFDNLEDYTEFLDWQKSQGIRCPVLYLQQTNDAQGQNVYKVRPSVFDLQGGLPPSILLPPNPTLLVDATRDDKPYNTQSFPAFDSTSYYVGTTTPLDTMNNTVKTVNANGNVTAYSPDPMDPNWGGNEFTQNLIDQGYYKGNEVQIRV